MIDGNDTIDARLLMGLMAQKFRPDGFLYYCVAMWRKYAKRPDGRFKIVSLREHPMSGAPRTNWLGYSWKDSNGDGNWFYPGEHAPVASLRLKNINDGLEDYHYWEMLRNAITQVRDGRSSMPEEWLKQADYALKGIDRLVSSLIHFTKRHRELEAERIRVGLLIEQFHTRR